MYRESTVSRLEEYIEKLSLRLEGLRLSDYIAMLQEPRRILFTNFLAGLARGLGAAVGFTILTAILIYVMKYLITLNLPVISSFIATIIQMVQQQTNKPY